MRTIVIAIGLALWATGASAEYAVLGPGNRSCGYWEQQRRTGNAYGLQAWVLGYLTRANYDEGRNRDLTAGTDAQGIFVWIDNYCRANPLKDVAAAAEHLVETLEKRK